MDSYLKGNCKYCDLEIEHHYEKHIFNTLNAIEECKYINKVVNHFLKNHSKEYEFSKLDKIGVQLRKIIRAILKDLLGIMVLPFSLIVSILYKVFEWLNDRIGMFD